MRWVKRGLLAILGIVVVVLAIAGFLWYRATREPEFLVGAPTVSAEEARRVVEALTAAPATADPAAPDRPASPRPWRLSLGEREVAAIVIANAPPVFSASVEAFRVRIRERDLVAAGTLRDPPLAGQTAWIDVRPAVGAGGALCLGFGGLHLGDADVPESLVREMTGGRGMPARRCLPPRGFLPGPLQSVEIAGGRVELRGYTHGP